VSRSTPPPPPHTHTHMHTHTRTTLSTSTHRTSELCSVLVQPLQPHVLLTLAVLLSATMSLLHDILEMGERERERRIPTNRNACPHRFLVSCPKMHASLGK
jgi:hypothetical protein